MNLKNLALIFFLSLASWTLLVQSVAEPAGEDPQVEVTAVAPREAATEEPGATLVYFGAKWCGACRLSKPGLEVLEATAAVNVVHVDVNQSKGDNYQKYGAYFEGKRLPYFALLDENGRKIHGFSGQQSFESLLKNIQGKGASA